MYHLKLQNPSAFNLHEDGAFNSPDNTYSEVTNQIEQLIQQPVPIKTVWAFLEPIRGHQQTEAQRLSNETTYKILTRYHKGINQEMLINYEGKKLYIHQVLDIEERHTYMELTAIWKGEMWNE